MRSYNMQEMKKYGFVKVCKCGKRISNNKDNCFNCGQIKEEEE